MEGHSDNPVAESRVDDIHVRPGRVFAAGPALKYDYRNMALSVKYELETEAENRPEGKNLWVKFTYAF